MVGEDEPQLVNGGDSGADGRRAGPRRLLIGIMLAVILVIVFVLLVLRPWVDGGAEPVEAPGVAPSAPLPER